MRKRRVAIVIVLGVLAVLVLGVGGWVLAVASRLDKGEPLIERVADGSPHRFVAQAIFAASDSDMLGTSYADGILQPIEGAHDALSRVDVEQQLVSMSDAIVSNSVTAWPGTLELAPDARYAYVIESRGARPAGVARVKNVHKDLVEGRLLTTVDVASHEQPQVVRTDDIAIDPTSVAVAPNGEWLAIAARDDRSPITFVVLDSGVPVEVRHPRLALPSVPPPPPQATEVESFAGVSYVRKIGRAHV